MTAFPRIADCLRQAQRLQGVSDTPRLDVEVLLTHVLACSRTHLYAWPEQMLSDRQQQDFAAAMARREAGEPVAHITGVREFWSLPLAVDASTLIPRPDTERLVEAVLEIAAGDAPDQVRHLLDLGTGTGAIALALASEKPRWQVLALDNRPEAVALAQRNARRLSLDQVVVTSSHWFSAVAGRRFDIIVSNPPYIDPADAYLQQGDLRFEPRSALVADDGGLADLKTIIAQAPAHLHDQGWLLLEHGCDQGPAVRDLCAAAGFVGVATLRDLAGLERVTRARYVCEMAS